ncbi:Aste57867_7009 [Aphanomyces stellatus]|uniref:Aste57867_7009 protein n=1 Tax=Aphanomyces stellatus TaxID=120398 RepID=A0A485KG88_9STRA|nr:hypothetical protein As57867_006986 [Aphanomyces stellatus]VFT83958.1 Aste57867_7009 [Aphanomyces stellatus]
MSQWEIWGALSNGATLVLRGENAFEALSTVDALICVPTGLGLLGDPSQYPKLKFVTLAGEPLPTSLKDLWAPVVQLTNCCGPSETTIISHSSLQQVDVNVNVGRPIPNMNCYVLDDKFRPVPIGVVGELFVGGIGVSPGYVNLPDETASKFISDPFSTAYGPMYRSGDFGRILPSGDFEIRGRRDNQVKLRGYRIELDEVAGAIMQHPQVITASALVKDKTKLVGYFSPANINKEELQEFVSARLPIYMVPSVWVGLEVMPQNSNGKIDKKALDALDLEIDFDPLVTKSEKRMASVWAHVMDVDISEIGRCTSFFAVGGDSMTAIKVVAACNAVGLTITTAQLLKFHVLWRAASIVSVPTPDAWPSITLSEEVLGFIRDEWAVRLNLENFVVYPATPLQAGMIYATMKRKHAYIMQVPLLLDPGFDSKSLFEAFRAVVEQHEILRTTFVTTATGIYQIIRNDTVDFFFHNTNESTIEAFLDLDRARGFEIGDKYFVRLTLVNVETDRYAVLSIHHALYDGWTLSMLTNDLVGSLQGKSLMARPSFRGVVDYIDAQNKATTEDFWRSYLSGYVSHPIASTGLTTEDSRPHEPLEMCTQVSLAEIKAAAQRFGVTPAEFNKVAWAVTLQKYTRQSDVVFGQVMANRDIPVKDADGYV